MSTERTTQYQVDRIRRLAGSTASWRGWDLLQLKTRRASVPWEYIEVISELLTGSESVLDMGCGDGRVLAALADRFARGIGVDTSKERIQRARLSLPMKLRMRVHFTRASAHAAPAPSMSFHAVLNRQAPLFPEEIDRVLAPGGVFIAQQVGKENARAIFAAFTDARGPLPPWPDEMMLPRTFEVLSSRDYEIVRHEEYDVPYMFGDASSLLYWLQKIPIPQDFDIEQDAETVCEILDRLGTPSGIVTNEHRELLVMRKPG